MTDILITQLADYAENKGLIEKSDWVYAINGLLSALMLDTYTPCDVDSGPLEQILDGLCDYAAEKGIIPENTVTYRDLFSTKLMGILTPRPSEVIARFETDYKISPETATDNYYKFSRDTNYIMSYRVARDIKWQTATEYGDLDITINLSKPEKDPKAIAAARNAKNNGYPRCLLCRENEGYAGRIDSPARQNHRVIPVTINNSSWFFQYSPYVYYNEHCIVFNGRHVPMKIDRAAFCKLFDFVRIFPHYFVGSNADLPIVGGSILSHDHFQGGRYTFAMAKAEIEQPLSFDGFPDVEAGIVKWPMSVIRLRCDDDRRIVDLADKILSCWRGYTDKEAFVFAETDGEPHNTITPIARSAEGKFEMDLVLRNNITTKEHPLGVFHPHAELHHIKKENIGLIEVMGLAVLPARLKTEMSALKDALLSRADIYADPAISKHADWANGIKARYELDKENIDEVLRREIGKVFCTVLEHAGVYKRNEAGRAAFLRFVKHVNGEQK